MRKFSFVALMALCFTFPGKVDANLTPASSQIIQLAQGEIDPALVETILKYIQVEYDMDYNCLCQSYQKGTLTIEKSLQGYVVKLADGGLIGILDDQLN